MTPIAPPRRRFLFGAGAAATFLAWIVPRSARAAPPAAAPSTPRPGYRLTEHVRRYYERANL